MTPLERARSRARQRLLGSDGSVAAAFDALGTGLSADELASVFLETPTASQLGEAAGRAWGLAMAMTIIAVEADRETRNLGRRRWFR